MRGSLVISAALLAMQASSAPAPKLPAGHTEKVLELRPLIDMPEGIAIDHRGNIYVSNRRLENDSRVCEILRIASDGEVTVVATLDPGVEDSFERGTAGLAVNSRDEVFAALISNHAATHGIWHLRRDGSLHRLPGSGQMIGPNAMTFSKQGDLYATDSVAGTVWRFPRGGGRGVLWIRDDLLTGVANGIAFVPPSSLFVANTVFGWIARIPIEPDGTAGQPEMVAIGPELLIIDGLVADVHGGLYGVIAGASILGTAPLVHVDPRTGAITSSTEEWGQFDFPTSLAFGRGPLDHKSLYVVNSGLFPEGRPEAAPGVVRVSVGNPGPARGVSSTADGPGELRFLDGLTPIQVPESDTVIRAPVRRVNGSTGAVSVDYVTVADTAGSSDFASANGTLTWDDGDKSTKVISVPIHQDSVVETDEDFHIRLRNPTGGATTPLLGDIQFVRILDDEPAGGGGGGSSGGGGSTGGGGGGGGGGSRASDGGGGAFDYLFLIQLASFALLSVPPFALRVSRGNARSCGKGRPGPPGP